MTKSSFKILITVVFSIFVSAPIFAQNSAAPEAKAVGAAVPAPVAAASVDSPVPVVATTQLSGQVLEKGTRKPLPFVNVFILSGPEGQNVVKAVTDQNGRYNFAAAPLGDVTFVVNVTNYRKYESDIAVTGERHDLIFYLTKTVSQYFETTVTDSRSRRDDTQKTLSQEDFLTAPGSGGDPVKAVQNLPGINRTSGGDARVVIQGSSPEDTLYNIEGQEVPLIFHFGGLESIVTPEAVSSVDYLSAGYGPEFGRDIGGHVGLNVRRPQTDRTHGMAFIDIFNAGGLIEGKAPGNGEYLVSGRYSYLGVVLKAATKGQKGFDLTVAPSFYDFNAQYNKKLSDQNEFRIFSIVSHDELAFLLSKPVNNDPKLRGDFNESTTFYRIVPEFQHQIDKNQRWVLSGGFGADDILVDLATNYFHLNSNSLSVRGDYENQISPTYKTNVGYDNVYTWYDVAVKFPNTFSQGGISNPIASGDLRTAATKGETSQVGVYWRNEISPEGTSWTYLPNLRIDHFKDTKETLPEPRLAARYKYSPTLTFRGATGLYYQQPSNEQLDPSFGNPDLVSERALHFAAGFDIDQRGGSKDGMMYSVTGFYKKLDQLVINSSAIVDRGGSLTSENYNNQGVGHIEGVETQAKWREGKNSVVVSYTYLQSRRQSPGQPELPSPYDQTHTLNVLASAERGPWLLGLRMRYVTGNPYTPVIGGIYDSDNDVYIPVRGGLYTARDKDFFQLDVRIDHKWTYDTWILYGYVDVENLTNQKNPQGKTYSYDYSTSKDVTGLPLLPTIGVKGEF